MRACVALYDFVTGATCTSEKGDRTVPIIALSSSIKDQTCCYWIAYIRYCNRYLESTDRIIIMDHNATSRLCSTRVSSQPIMSTLENMLRLLSDVWIVLTSDNLSYGGQGGHDLEGCSAAGFQQLNKQQHQQPGWQTNRHRQTFLELLQSRIKY